MKKEEEEIALNFMRAVYPDHTDLALSTITETEALKGATMLILSLRKTKKEIWEEAERQFIRDEYPTGWI